MTPFERAGYTKHTEFKVLKDFHNIGKGDIVTLSYDDRSNCPWFRSEGGASCEMYLPGMCADGLSEDLEVYEEFKELTPFEEVGYTKDTKFKVLVDYKELKVGDIVTLSYDNRSGRPWFETEDGVRGEMCLPNRVPRGVPEELEVYENAPLKKENVDSVVPPLLSVTRTILGTTKIYLSDSIELPNIDSDENGTYVEIGNEVIVNAYKTLRDSVI